MKKISLFILIITLFIAFTVIAQQSYQPTYPNYSIELTKAGSNSPTGNLFIYGGQTVPVYEVGKLTNTPTYKRAFYQWNINNSQVPSVAIIDSIALEFDAQFVNNQTSTLNYFNCWLDLSDPNLNKTNLWNYSDKTQNTPIGEGQINTPPSNYVTQRHSFFNGSNFVSSFISALQQNNRFTLGVAWKYESPSAGNVYWRIKPINLKVYFHIPNQSVTLDQRLSNNTQAGKLRKWEGPEIGFTPPPYINPGTQFDFPLLSTQTIQGDQAIYSGEKYNNWNDDKTDVRNHKEFLITALTNQLTSKFEPTKPSIIIQNNLESSSTSGGNLHFKDPWLIDYPDPLYGNTLRNRGMDAPFKQRPSPFYPDYTTSYNSDVYKGVFLNQDYRVPGQPYYSVKANAVQDVNLQHTGKTHRFYFQNWSANPPNSAVFQNANALETPVVFKQEGATVQANLKGTQLSNTETAFANNSQRKFVRLNNGHLFSVYESMGNIYLERSTNNGQSWEIVNNGKKLNTNNYITHSPSIEFSGNISGFSGEVVFVTYVVDYSEYSDIFLLVCEDVSVVIQPQYVFSVEKGNDNGNPAISSVGSNFIIVFKGIEYNNQQKGLLYRRGKVTKELIPGEAPPHQWVFNWVDASPSRIELSNENSKFPTIAEDKSTSGISYQLAWEQEGEIYYCKLNEDSQGNIIQSGHSVISKGSGYKYNTKPSIIAIGEGARICWIGQSDPHLTENFYSSAVFTSTTTPGRYWSFGNYVNSVSINKSHSRYVIGWATSNDDYIRFTDSRTLSDIYTLNLRGRYVQVSNGTTAESMHALSFNTSAQPYFINTSVIPLAPQAIIVYEKRAGVVSPPDGTASSAEIYFNIGDIKVNQQKVSFVEIPDTANINSLQTANQYLESKPFSVTDNSDLLYSVQYGLTDSLLALSMLSGNKSITFKVQLLDAVTNEILGVFDEVTYDENNLTPYEKIDYQVLTNGIGNRLVKMRLVISNNFASEYSVLEKIEEPDGLAKRNYKQISYQGSLAVKEYSLEQNYPNPFNPSTVIRWQSPVASHQTLKVYDALGREVATLVNQWREAGRYSVEFDGSKLASGVYIYKLTAGSYTASRKMMILM
jgi:hypothetical protein